MNGYYFLLIHGWLQFFKVENGEVFALETGKTVKWFPTIVDASRLERMNSITIDEAKSCYHDLVTQNKKASNEDVLGSIQRNFSEKRLIF